MRFLNYLQEKVIIPDKGWINSFINKFTKTIDYFLKSLEGDFIYYDSEIIDLLHTINFDDAVGFEYGNLNPRFSCIIQAYANKDGFMEIELNEDDFREIINDYKQDGKKSTLWGEFIQHLKEVMEHEYIHLDQFEKGAGSTDRDKLIKKFGDAAYNNDRMEMMAHAHSVIKELEMKGYNKLVIMNMIRNMNNENFAKLSDSKSFYEFYFTLKGTPAWKKFLKYLYQYLEEL